MTCIKCKHLIISVPPRSSVSSSTGPKQWPRPRNFGNKNYRPDRSFLAGFHSSFIENASKLSVMSFCFPHVATTGPPLLRIGRMPPWGNADTCCKGDDFSKHLAADSRNRSDLGWSWIGFTFLQSKSMICDVLEKHTVTAFEKLVWWLVQKHDKTVWNIFYIFWMTVCSKIWSRSKSGNISCWFLTRCGHGVMKTVRIDFALF